MEIYTSYEVQIKGIANITTRIADSDSVLGSFVEKLKKLILDYNISNQRKSTKKPVVVGLDVEYGTLSSSEAAILQLCFGSHCVIIQLFHMKTSRISFYLNGFFADNNIVFVGVGIKDKLANLKVCYKFQCCKNVIELGSLADRVRRTSKLLDFKLEELAREIVGIEIKKPNSLKLSNWRARELSSEQIEYATIIAYASYSIGNKLLTEGVKVEPIS